MAQANPTQREPSMEEILASIRRIIEDSDNDKKRDAMPVARAANDMAETGRAVEAFRAGLRDERVPDEQLRDVFMEQAFTVGGDAESRPDEIEDDQTYTPEMARSETNVQLEDFSALESDTELFSLATPPQDEPTDFDIDLDIDAFAETNEIAAAAPSEPEPQPEPAAASEEPLQQPVEQQVRAPILSERTGKQVAAAFGELSEAFAASRRKSFDEMAEEMIRPMLQDWMDNNLPHLVERLVREEIERIARG